jgi:FkbM family methyltransferase
MKIISYSQNREDIVLRRALRDVRPGFYIDVGANDPVDESVTKIFYDDGWRGINIEPLSACYDRLQLLRSRDINIQALVGAERGKCILYEFPDDGRYSTVDKIIADRHERTLGLKFRKSELPLLTLSSVCEQHAVREIHFLKIDVEGHEAQVLQGFDLVRYRPWILVIEATEPSSQVDASGQWEDLVLRHGYEFALFDGLSKFYVSKEQSELKASLMIPPNIFDNYVTASEAKMLTEIKQANSLRWLGKRLMRELGLRVKSIIHASQFR